MITPSCAGTAVMNATICALRFPVTTLNSAVNAVAPMAFSATHWAPLTRAAVLRLNSASHKPNPAAYTAGSMSSDMTIPIRAKRRFATTRPTTKVSAVATEENTPSTAGAVDPLSPGTSSF